MKTCFKAVAAAAAALMTATPAAATIFTCTATELPGIGVSGAGNLMVATNFGTFAMCNIHSTFESVAAQTCQAWASQLLSAPGLHRKVTFYFNTSHWSNSGMTSCASNNFDGSYRVPAHVSLDL